MKWLENIIDNSLDKMAEDEASMWSPDPNMPNEMYDSTILSDSDWKAWKPIPSTLNDSDLNELEKIIERKLPLSYRHFLKYKHFYKLNIPDFAVNFPPHLPDKTLVRFKKWFLENNEGNFLLENGLIHFADFQDYGLLCFDSKIEKKNNEYPIVFIDHEDFRIKHTYSEDFKELMRADEERGNRFIQKLNDFYG